MFGADDSPDGAPSLRIVRSPFHRARFQIGDGRRVVTATPGVVAVMTAADIEGRNLFGVIPATIDQPVFAEPDEEIRFRGEAVAMIVGEPEAMAALDITMFPVMWDGPATRHVDLRGPGRGRPPAQRCTRRVTF